MDKKELIQDLQTNGITPQNKEFLVNAMTNGPYYEERKLVWLEATGANMCIRSNPTYYSTILEIHRNVETNFTAQIDKDLWRTFPQEEFFIKNATIQSLRNVLVAYSYRNPNIGYCQGMNFIAGRLLSLGFTQEQSFWIMAHIVEVLLPIDYFSVMTGVVVDQKVFNYLLKKAVPEVYYHFKEIKVEASFFVVQWFICMYSYSFPENVLVRIWDILFVKGNVYLMQVGLAILWNGRQKLLEATNINEIMTVLNTLTHDFKDPDHLICLTNKKRFNANQNYVDKLRRFFKTGVDKEMDKLDSNSNGLETVVSFSEECQGIIDCRKKMRKTSSFFTFQTSHKVHILDNYLDNESYPFKFDTSLLRDAQLPLLLGRRNHKCMIDSNSQELSNKYEVQNSQALIVKNKERKVREMRHSLVLTTESFEEWTRNSEIVEI